MLRDIPNISGPDADIEIFMTSTSGSNADDHATNPVYQDPLDDVFGSAPSSPVLPARDSGDAPNHAGNRNDLSPAASHIHNHHPSDIPRLRSLHVTNGYREGISVSKERHLQEGFDEGYSLGAELGLKAGWCLGVLSGLQRAVSSGRCKRADSSDELRVWREEVTAILREAEKDLAITELCGKEWFGEDGVWTYEVPIPDEPTFDEVAAAHPVLVKWRQRIRELVGRVNLDIGGLVK